MRMRDSGVSGRSVGKTIGMNKSNVYNWKNDVIEDSSSEIYEPDELYEFMNANRAQKHAKMDTY